MLQQETGRELADSDELFGMYQGENKPSESHPFLNQVCMSFIIFFLLKKLLSLLKLRHHLNCPNESFNVHVC